MNNKRTEILEKINEAENLDDAHEFVKEFIDDIEREVNEISSLLEKFSIDNLDNIIEARDKADYLGTELY